MHCCCFVGCVCSPGANSGWAHCRQVWTSSLGSEVWHSPVKDVSAWIGALRHPTAAAFSLSEGGNVLASPERVLVGCSTAVKSQH